MCRILQCWFAAVSARGTDHQARTQKLLLKVVYTGNHVLLRIDRSIVVSVLVNYWGIRTSARNIYIHILHLNIV